MSSLANTHYKKKMASAALTLAALGIFFGDIGTSPLYAIREAFHGPHAMPATPENIFGISNCRYNLTSWNFFQ